MKGKPRGRFDEYLRLQRQRRGLDLTQLAIATRMPLPRLITLESGAASPDKQEVRGLARALDIPFETLLAKAGL